MEVKLSVNNPINSDDKDKLAQLFYETRLIWLKEGCRYTHVLGIYGNHAHRHFFKVSFSSGEKLDIISYAVVSSLSHDTVKKLITTFIK